MKTGDKVVCINGKWELNGIRVVEGEIYTVVGVTEYPNGVFSGAYFKLREIAGAEFWHGLFRPVDDTFGSLVEEIISKQVEVEEMETV